MKTDNLAELELDFDVARVVLDGYRLDDASRSDYIRLLEQINKILEVDLSSKSYPFDKASNVAIPVLNNACITFAARALPAFFKDGSILKAKPVGDDTGKYELSADPNVAPIEVEAPGSKQKRADRVAMYMNWQLLEKMENWEEDFDDLLHKLPAYGSVFRKVYYSEADRLKHSDLIYPHFLCVNIDAESLERADRITHLYSLSRHEIIEKVNEGIFVDFDLGDDYEDGIGLPHKFIEQHTRLDLDGDGYPEPYIVTVHEDTETVVSIYKRFDEIVFQDEEETEISRITALNYFVHYKFFPDPLGGFYGQGFGHLVLKLNNTLNTLINQIIDTGHMSLMGGGFLGKGLRMRGGQIRIPMGKFLPVNASGTDLKNNIVPMNFPPPSGTTLTLFDSLLQYTKNLAGMRDVLEGQIRSDQTATATLAQIDNSLNEFRSVFKRIRMSLKREGCYLYRLNADYPDAEEYAEVLDMPELDIERDINVGTYDIYPVADTSELTNLQRTIKAEAILNLVQSNLVAPKPAVENYLQSMHIADYEKYLDFEPTSQDVQLQQQLLTVEQQKAQAEMLKQYNKTAEIEVSAAQAGADIMYKTARAVDTLAQAEEREEGANLQSYISQIKQLISDWEKDYGVKVGRQGAIPGMEDAPGNAEVMQAVGRADIGGQG